MKTIIKNTFLILMFFFSENIQSSGTPSDRTELSSASPQGNPEESQAKDMSTKDMSTILKENATDLGWFKKIILKLKLNIYFEERNNDKIKSTWNKFLLHICDWFVESYNVKSYIKTLQQTTTCQEFAILFFEELDFNVVCDNFHNEINTSNFTNIIKNIFSTISALPKNLEEIRSEIPKLEKRLKQENDYINEIFNKYFNNKNQQKTLKIFNENQTMQDFRYALKLLKSYKIIIQLPAIISELTQEQNKLEKEIENVTEDTAEKSTKLLKKINKTIQEMYEEIANLNIESLEEMTQLKNLEDQQITLNNTILEKIKTKNNNQNDDNGENKLEERASKTSSQHEEEHQKNESEETAAQTPSNQNDDNNNNNQNNSNIATSKPKNSSSEQEASTPEKKNNKAGNNSAMSSPINNQSLPSHNGISSMKSPIARNEKE